MLYYLKRAVASAINDRNVGTFVDYRVVTIHLAECLPSTTRDNPRQVRSKRNKYPASICRVHCGKTQPLACAIFPKLAAISPGRQPIPRRLLNKKSEQNQQKIEKPGRGSEFPRSTRRTNPLHDGQPLSHGFTTHRLDARTFSQRAVNWNRADRNYPLNMFAPGFPTAL
jgi:hypothetical protein